MSSLINDYSEQRDDIKEVQGPVFMLVRQFREMGYTFGGNMILHKHNEPSLDIIEHPWQHLKKAIFDAVARHRVDHVNNSRTFHKYVPEIDRSIVREVMHKLGPHEQNVYRCLGTGATWDQKQLCHVWTNEHSEACPHCGVGVESGEHVSWECSVINSHRKSRELCNLDHSALPTCIKVGIPVAMHAKFDGPYWGRAMQPDGDIPAGIGVPPSTGMYGAQCVNNILSQELDNRNQGDQFRNANARQAFMSLKQNLESPHVVLPYHCVFDAPEQINVYTDGSWINPRKFHFALGGAGVWWPNRTLRSLPLSTAEKELTHQQFSSRGIRLCAAIGGFSGSSTRNELAAGIIAVCAHGPVHLASDSKIFVDRANEVIQRLQECPHDKTNYSTTSDGDLWMYFAKAVKSKGSQSVRVTWVKGHATCEHVAQGISTSRDKEGNDIADSCADMGVLCHGEGLVLLANEYTKRHGLYSDFMTLVVKHIIEAHMIHRDLVRTAGIKAANSQGIQLHKWTFQRMAYITSLKRTRKLQFTASMKSFPKICQHSNCIHHIENFLRGLYICESSAEQDASHGLSYTSCTGFVATTNLLRPKLIVLVIGPSKLFHLTFSSSISKIT